MRTKHLSLCLIAFFILAGLGWWIFSANENIPCHIWPVSISPFNNQPYINVQLERSDQQLLLDLGSKFELSLRKPLIDNLQHKKKLGQVSWRGIKGNLYYGTQYQIPELKIGTKIFKKMLTTEEDDNFFLIETTVHHPQEPIRTDEEHLKAHNGIIGWPILLRTNLLLDFPNSQICATNSLKQLETLGYHIEKWQKIPFSVDRGMILDVTTDCGVQKLVFDTGTTLTTIDKTLALDRDLQEKHPGINYFRSSKFILGGVDFGETKICTLEWPKEAEHFHGLIGMDFIRDFIWYIDYKHKCIYVGKKQRTTNVKGDIAEFHLTFSQHNTPLLNLNIQDQKYTVAFDTGTSVTLSLETNALQKIDAQKIGDFSFQTGDGKKRRLNRFFAKHFDLNHARLNDVYISQDDTAQQQFGEDNAHISGIIGRDFLNTINFLFDIPHQKAYAANSFDALEQKGYAVRKWTAVPYRENNWGLVVTLKTDLGNTRFLIHTGTPKTAIRDTLSPEQSPWISKQCAFEGRNFGPTRITPLADFPCPEEIDGVLGIDFLGKYPFYIDHLDQILYIGN